MTVWEISKILEVREADLPLLILNLWRVRKLRPYFVTRDDVTSATASVTTKTRYDIAGSVVARLDPLGRKVRVEYTDVFNNSSEPGTFAYPTKVYDPAGNFSEVEYRFDIGANVWAQSPAPQSWSVGKTTERVFDSIGRLSKETILNTGAYTRYEYPTNGLESSGTSGLRPAMAALV